MVFFPFFAHFVLLKMEVGIRKEAWRRAWRYPAYLWSLRWVYAVKKTRKLVYAVYPRIPPPNTPLDTAYRVWDAFMCFASYFCVHFRTKKTKIKSSLMDHLTSNSLLNSHQSAYCRHHSTETALLCIHDYLISAMGSQNDRASAYSTSLPLSTLLTMTSWSPVSHPGMVSMALFSAGSNHICHLVAFVQSVKPTCPPGTLPPAVSPRLCPWSTTLRHVHHSSQYPHFLLFPKPYHLYADDTQTPA